MRLTNLESFFVYSGMLALGVTVVCQTVALQVSDQVHISSRYTRWKQTDAAGVSLAESLASNLGGLSPNSLSLVVVMGSCGSCSAKGFKPGQEMPGKYERVFLVYESSEHEMKRHDPRKLHERYRLVADPYGKVSDALLVDLPPRLFEINGLGQVTRAQTGIHTVDRMLKGEN